MVSRSLPRSATGFVRVRPPPELKIPDRMSENEPKSAAVAPPPAAAGAAAEGVAAGEHGAAAVVLLALVRIAEHVVGLGDRLEALLGPLIGVRVRVVLARELAVRLLDVLLGGLLVDPERLVVILGLRHRYPATTTRAGRSTAPLIR